MDPILVETPRLNLRRMTPDDVPALLRVFGDEEVMRFYPAPFDEVRMQRWAAWNHQHDAEHGHGLWAMILRATGECIGNCGLAPQQVDGLAEACFLKPKPTGRRMGAKEFRNPFFYLFFRAIFTKRGALQCRAKGCPGLSAANPCSVRLNLRKPE